MPKEFEDQSPEKPDLKEYWALARRRCWYFVLPLFLGWLIVFTVSRLLPPVYRSSTLILVEQPTVSQQYVAPNVSGDLQIRLNSITQQILSRPRLWHVIETLNLYPKERTRLTPDEVVEHMRKHIDIDMLVIDEAAQLQKPQTVRFPHSEQLTAFSVNFSADTPHTAQAVTSELARVFISENLVVRQQQSESTTQFLQSQLEVARNSLTEQETRLREYKDRYLGELPSQLWSNMQTVSGYKSQLQAEQDALGRAKQHNLYLESLRARYSSATTSTRAATATDQELEKLQAQLADLISRYSDRHPDVRKVKEQIEITEKRKRQIRADLTKAMGDQKNDKMDDKEENPASDLPAILEVQRQLEANQLEIANRQETIRKLTMQIDEYQARVHQTPMLEQQLGDLNRDYEQSKANYESLLAKKNQSELATNLEMRQESEHFRILDPPSLPVKPYSPNRFRLACLGLAAGFVLGAASVAATELTDDRIYSEKELKKLLPANVLTEIPPLVTPDEERRQRRQAWRDLLGVTAVFLCIMAGVAMNYLRG